MHFKFIHFSGYRASGKHTVLSPFVSSLRSLICSHSIRTSDLVDTKVKKELQSYVSYIHEHNVLCILENYLIKFGKSLGLSKTQSLCTPNHVSHEEYCLCTIPSKNMIIITVMVHESQVMI